IGTLTKMFLYSSLISLNIMTSAVRGRVEKELSPECRKFLYMGTPPTGLALDSLRFICQRYHRKPRYVTLYNIVDRIPVYSAYTFKRSDGLKCVDVPWMYEPQLSTSSATDEMQPFPRGYTPFNSEDNQAVLDDYANAILYERGTLNPDEHQNEPDDKASTYTLTNVVPVVPEFNIQLNSALNSVMSNCIIYTVLFLLNMKTLHEHALMNFW
uniref:DNA/RNA non-specific endonuclease/pyrophosphatase/phosphodiesterase domain-containing protein n=1 Tax=Mastacembelus armatus TaxID=205130 RepID=A0A7N8Y3D9_9TELE